MAKSKKTKKPKKFKPGDRVEVVKEHKFRGHDVSNTYHPGDIATVHAASEWSCDEYAGAVVVVRDGEGHGDAHFIDEVCLDFLVTDDEVQAAIASIASVNVSQKVREIAESLPPEPFVYMAMWCDDSTDLMDPVGVYVTSAVAEEAVSQYALGEGFAPLVFEDAPDKTRDVSGRISQDFVTPSKGFFAVLRCSVLEEARIWDVPDE